MLAALRRRLRPCSLFLLLAFSLTLFAAPLRAARPESSFDEAMDQVTEINQKTIEGLHTGLNRFLVRLVDRLNAKPSWNLEIRSNFADRHGRIFCHVVGDVVLHVPLCSEKKAAEIDGAAGYRLATDGPLSVDFSIEESERIGQKRWRLKVDASIVIVVKEFLRTLVKNGASFLGTVTLSLCAGRVIEMLRDMDLDLLGRGMENGLNGVAGLLTGEASGQAYETIAHFEGRDFVDSLKKSFSHRSVVYAFGAGLVSVAIHSGTSVIGTTLGATLGTFVCPGVGTTIGGALGAAIFGLLGNVVVTFLTKTLPFKYTLWRLRRYHEWGWAERHAGVTERLVEAVRLEIETDRYRKLSLLIERLEAEHAEGNDLAAYRPLIDGILDLLRYSMVAEENWHGARKYYQLLAAIGELPGRESSVETGEE